MIVREGDVADAFYVLVSGTARVVKRGETGEEVPLNVLRPGDSFGEIGLLEDTTRIATVRASGDVEALRLDRAMFGALVRTNPELRESFELSVRQRHLRNFFRLYTAFAHLPADGLAALLRGLEPRRRSAQGDGRDPRGRAAGPDVRRRGRPAARLRGTTAPSDATTPTPQGRLLRRGRRCSAATPRAATVEAVSDATLLALPPDAVPASCSTGYPEFRTRIEERVAQYEYKRLARVPLDFAEELLPGRGRRPTSRAGRATSPRPSARPRTSRRSPARTRRRRRRATAAGASRTSTRSTRWTAAPPAWRWSRATTATR